MPRFGPETFAAISAVAPLVMAIGLMFAQPASAGLFDDDEARKDLRNLRAQVEKQSAETDARLNKLDESIRNLGIVSLLGQIEQLTAEIARLRGENEVIANQNEQLVRRQKEFYLDIDARLAKLENATPSAEPATSSNSPGATSGAQSTTGASSAAIAPASASRVVSTVNKDREAKAYDNGLEQIKRGDFAAAIRGFEGFVRDYPASPLVSNAQYWIGLSLFNLKDYSRSRLVLETLLKSQPDAAKSPDALLTIASIQAESGDAGSARNTLEDVIARYPGSEAAAKARSRLASARR